jgi:signal transduction histidine kinase
MSPPSPPTARRDVAFAAWTAFGFALVTAVMAIAMVVSSVLAKAAAERRELLVLAYSDSLDIASRAQLAAERIVTVGRGVLLAEAPELEARVKAAAAELTATLDMLEHRARTGEERDLLVEVRRSARRYTTVLDAILADTSMRDGRETMAAALRDRLLPERERLDESLGSLVGHWRKLDAESREAARRMASQAFVLSVGIGSAGVLASAMLALMFTRRLAQAYRQEQEATDRARGAIRAKEELLGVVAHDLRNPLGAIVVNASLLQRRSQNPEIGRHVRSIESLAKRMGHLVASLLDAAAMEAGRFSIRLERCTASEILGAAVEMFAGAAKERGIDLEPRDDAPGADFPADRERVLQVLSNLLGNALKFTPRGGRITIVAATNATSARFEVADTGPGIGPEQARHIFERYWKAEAGGRHGVGLGLFIAKGIVESHGGRIRVDSVVGQGSTFIFEIPRAPGWEATSAVARWPAGAPPGDAERAAGDIGAHP